MYTMNGSVDIGNLPSKGETQFNSGFSFSCRVTIGFNGTHHKQIKVSDSRINEPISSIRETSMGLDISKQTSGFHTFY